MYTTTDSSSGNKSLTYPIGLLTADEAALAGVTWSNPQSSYLNTGENYWTMSPYSFVNSNAYVFRMISAGYIYGSLLNYSVKLTNGVRPVINIKADVPITGSGTTTDPFRVVGAS